MPDNSNLLPITNIIDVSRAREINIKSPEFRDLLVNMVENINSLLSVINSKDTAIYSDEETITGQSAFNSDNDSPNSVLRKFIDFGALSNSATKSVAHGLDSAWAYKFTRIYGVSTDSTNKVYLPIPYSSSTAADIIELYVDNTNINIVTGKDRTSFDKTYVVIEYIE